MLTSQKYTPQTRIYKYTGPVLPVQLKKSVITPKKQIKCAFSKLPTELSLHIFDMLAMQDLSQLRLVNKSLGLLAEDRILNRLNTTIPALKKQYAEMESNYQQLYSEKKPQLRHFRGFLRNLSSTQLTEVTWYNNPSHELLTVCECLCMLKGVDLKGETEVQKWAEIKKIMSRHDFKTWYLNLRKNVEKIDVRRVLQVQNIIIRDQTITYERVREVTMAGYHLLISIAACLQFCSLAKDLKIRKSHMALLLQKLNQQTEYKSAILTSNVYKH